METDTLDAFTAREIASDWHSGQFTAMYAFASSGHLDKASLESEIGHELRDPHTLQVIEPPKIERLRALLAFVTDPATPDDGDVWGDDVS